MGKWKNVEIDFKSPDGSVTKYYIEEVVIGKKKHYHAVEEEISPPQKEDKTNVYSD